MDSEYEVVPLGSGSAVDDGEVERGTERPDPWGEETVSLHAVGDEAGERAARLQLVRSRRSRRELVRRGVVAGALLASLGLGFIAFSGGEEQAARKATSDTAFGRGEAVALGPARAISTPLHRDGSGRDPSQGQRHSRQRASPSAAAKESGAETLPSEGLAEQPAEEMLPEPVQEPVSPDPVRSPPPPPPQSEAASAEFGFEH